jgi:hypothetical protein
MPDKLIQTLMVAEVGNVVAYTVFSISFWSWQSSCSSGTTSSTGGRPCRNGGGDYVVDRYARLRTLSRRYSYPDGDEQDEWTPLRSGR